MLKTENNQCRKRTTQIKDTAVNGSLFDVFSYGQLQEVLRLGDEKGINYILGEMIFSCDNAGFDITELLLSDPELRSFFMENAIVIYKATVSSLR